MTSFVNKLSSNINSCKSNLCIGIDPPNNFNNVNFLSNQLKTLGAERYLQFFCESLLQAAKDKAPAVKFQSAYFESFGLTGMGVMREMISQAKSLKYHVILDNKRNDISSTMEAYGSATFDFFMSDSMTTTFNFGTDSILALKKWLISGKGVYIVWVSSNPSALSLQNLILQNQQPFYDFVLDEIIEFAERENILDTIGLVLGATKIDNINKIILEKAAIFPFLIPGVGMQGAAISQRLKMTMKLNSTSLLPISRGLFLDAKSSLDSEITDEVSFKRHIETKINSFNDQLRS